ncbi:MAG: EipB family protein [Alphaproteobacteria bacterium]
MTRVLITIVLFLSGSLLEAAIAPHRAYYKVSMISAQDRTSIIDTKGTMTLKMDRVCDGWTIEQNSKTLTHTKMGIPEELIAHYVAWESESGDQLRFYTRRQVNSMTTERIDGVAGFGETQGTVDFNHPEIKTFPLGKATVPPMQHLQKILSLAEKGESMTSATVFDGSYFGEPVNISVFVGKASPACQQALGAVNQWPLHMAIFDQNSQDANPNFVINQNMSDNGVMCSYTIDFGDYKVRGDLQRVEYLDEKSCG